MKFFFKKLMNIFSVGSSSS